MSAEPNQPRLFDKLETQSSLYQKLPPSLRRQVDRAIVDHDPPTYRAVFDKFKLAAHAVSFTAFYRYARRIRTNAALVELASLALPEGAPVDKFLPEIVGERFLEAALDEETSPQTLHRLAVTHRIAIQNHIACTTSPPPPLTEPERKRGTSRQSEPEWKRGTPLLTEPERKRVAASRPAKVRPPPARTTTISICWRTTSPPGRRLPRPVSKPPSKPSPPCPPPPIPPSRLPLTLFLTRPVFPLPRFPFRFHPPKVEPVPPPAARFT